MAPNPTPKEPIAIVGIGCRFPGNSSTPSKLWELLASPTDLSQTIPRDRFNASAFYHPEGEYHGTTNSTKAYFLAQSPRVFDAAFFSITPAEAEAMDPQQRLMLEVAFETLESSSYPLPQLAGKDIGVYAGVMTADYDTLSQRDDLTASQYYATGNARSIISNRLSYVFDFHGPSMTIDTACSSSLVALHQAVLSLRAGECPLALVAGVNLMLTPEQFIVESSLHMLSPTGHCRMWDRDADGYARGEGVAGLLLKPLGAAVRDGDDIRGLIRETGSNSDGKTPGLTMPSVDAQTKLIRDTYARAGLDLERAEDRPQYFEAHGTGTQAGDPREAEAIQRAFFPGGQLDTTHDKLLVGSVKTVIGHSEGAAGLAGVIKVLEAMRHGIVPPNLHFDNLNDKVAPFYHHLQVPITRGMVWLSPSPGQPLRASVNSFGFGGANAHAIVEKYDPAIHDSVTRNFTQQVSTNMCPSDFQLSGPVRLPFVISAASETSLRKMAKAVRDSLQDDNSISVEAMASQLLLHRTAHPHRMVLPPSSRNELVSLITSTLGSDESVPVGTRAKRLAGHPRVLGIFTGQGAQWPTMSRGLLESNAIFARTIRELDAVLVNCKDPPSWSLEEQIMAEGDDSRVREAAVSQPLCTAIQIGLIDVLKRFGLQFDVVVGHSSGEIAAAYAAGFLSKEDALLVSYYRGFYANLAGGPNGEAGSMVAVGMSEQEAQALCDLPEFQGKMCIAACNSSTSCTLAGNLETVNAVRDTVISEGKFARLLSVDTAYHNKDHMRQPGDAYVQALKSCNISPLTPGNGTVWVSSVHDRPLSIQRLKSDYWRDNMVSPVQFHRALEQALRNHGPFDLAVEVGPHPALKSSTTQTIEEATGVAIPYSGVLNRKEDDSIAFANHVGFLWQHTGNFYDFSTLLRDSTTPELARKTHLDLPLYIWDHSQSFWREGRIARQYHFREDPPHELLGSRTRDDTDMQMRWRNVLHLKRLPWLAGHKFQGGILVPASAYCIMAIDAARTLLKHEPAAMIELEDLEFPSGTTIEDDHFGTETLFTLKVLPPSRKDLARGAIVASVTLSSCKADGTSPMNHNVSGRVRIIPGPANNSALPPRPHIQAEALPVSSDAFYQMMVGIGLDYTGPFKSLRSLKRHLHFATGVLDRFHKEDSTGLSISPATLDACLQLCFATFASPGDRALWTTFLPVRIDRIRFNVPLCDSRTSPSLTVDANLTSFAPNTQDKTANITGDISIYNARSEMEVQVQGLTVGSFAPSAEYREMYLHTELDVDPEDYILPLLDDDEEDADTAAAKSTTTTTSPVARYPMLREHAERIIGSVAPALLPLPLNLSSLTTLPIITASVAAHTSRPPSSEPWLLAPEALESFMCGSRHFTALRAIRTLAARNPDVLLALLGSILKEAAQLSALQDALSGVAEQLAHKYPRMHVLGLTDVAMSLTEHVVDGLAGSFASYTCGTELEENLEERVREKDMRKCVGVQLDLAGGDFATGLPAGALKFDLVVLCTTVVRAGKSASVLEQVRGVMKPGGFLVVVEAKTESLEERIGRSAETEEPKSSPSSADWTERLNDAGFIETGGNCLRKFKHRLSLIVRQSPCEKKQMLRQASLPLPRSGLGSKIDRLLLIGGINEDTAQIPEDIRNQLEGCCTDFYHASSLHDLDIETANSHDAVILLSDLDGGILSSLTDATMDMLRVILRPEAVVLWVTHQADTDNPENAASFGFARTVLAETSGLVLQMLNLNSLVDAGKHILQAFTRLMVEKSVDLSGSLYVHEPEVHILSGKRVVPRVLPLKAPNDRYNAVRRTVTESFNSLEGAVKLVKSTDAEGMHSFSVRDSSFPTASFDRAGGVRIQVHYCTLLPVQVRNLKKEKYICYGVDIDAAKEKDRFVVALCKTPASYVLAVRNFVIKVRNVPQPDQLPSQIAAEMFIQALLSGEETKTFVFINAPGFLINLARATQGGGTNFRFWTTNEHEEDDTRKTYLHPLVTARDLAAKLPDGIFAVHDFSTRNVADFSDVVKEMLPEDCRYNPDPTKPWVGQYYGLRPSNSELADLFKKALEQVQSLASDEDLRKDFQVLSVPAVLQKRDEPFPPFATVDWRQERLISQPISPDLDLKKAFDKNGVYILVGLTRDLGASLCRLFISKGAKNLVIASRNPPADPAWKTVLETTHDGVKIDIESVDVTDLASVEAFKRRVEERFPRTHIDGLVNGAMVLDDRVFAQMDAATLHRVLRPKTVGSSNLDHVFDSNMSFFIMTSSFAAIGGHAGQSNYAAANMYMNGLAAARRGRGLAASVLNIGVIYGLGFLQRERDELYAGLEREGYPPISEHDLHHMFLEAIHYGRPVENQIDGLTTGLSRFRADAPNLIPWQRDPRFSHFTVDDGGEVAKIEGEETKEKPVKELLVEVKTEAEGVAILLPALTRQLEVLVRATAGSISGESSVSDVGIDSLVAVDFRSWIYQNVGRSVPVMKILSSSSIANLCRDIVQELLKQKEEAEDKE